jgi:hypothetical protein
LFKGSVGKGGEEMRVSDYSRVCYITEQREDAVPLRNLRTGEIGYSFGCTVAGETVQVRLTSGQLDSWSREECSEMIH